MEQISIKLPPSVQAVFDILEQASCEAYVVGGAVRDALRGAVPIDFDVTTNALPETVVTLFSPRYRVIETGLKHGTVTVLIDGEPIEITTYRIDGDYKDARRPDSVSYSDSLTDDLSRRDFTVNAIAYHPAHGIVDRFDGMRDLKDHVLRCIGEPEKRFAEDALRILRALRFSAKLDFTIEDRTAAALVKLRGLLMHISKERIRAELEKMFASSYPARLAEVLIEYRPVFEQIFPQMAAYEAYEALCRETVLLPAENNLRFVWFLGAFGDLRTMLTDLRCSNAFIRRACHTLDAVREGADVHTSPDARFLLYRHGEDACRDAATILSALGKNAQLPAILEHVLRNGDCIAIADLAIKGNDLSALNLPPARRGKLLEAALFAVMRDEIPNRRSSLLEFVNNFTE